MLVHFGLRVVLLVVVALAGEGCWPRVQSGADTPLKTCTFGTDTLEFPNAFALPGETLQAHYAKSVGGEKEPDPPPWYHPGIARDRAWTRRPDSPFRSGVWIRENLVTLKPNENRLTGTTRYLVSDGKTCAIVDWDNIGYFLKPLDTAAECAVVVDLLGRAYDDEQGLRSAQITGRQLRKVVQKIDSVGTDLPLKVLKRDFEDDLLSGEPTRERGIWRVGLVRIERTCAVEYKYALDSENHVARLRRVIVEGPPCILLGGQTDDMLSGEPRKLMQTYRRCQAFLKETAGVPKSTDDIGGK